MFPQPRWSDVTLERRRVKQGATGRTPIGARACRWVAVFLGVDSKLAEKGRLVVTGGLSVELAGVEVRLELTDPNGRYRVERLRTDAEGRFAYDSAQTNDRLIPGLYALRAFVLSDPILADAKSAPVTAEIQVPIRE